jgi:large subunit ribosomal protein L36
MVYDSISSPRNIDSLIERNIDHFLCFLFKMFCVVRSLTLFARRLACSTSETVTALSARSSNFSPAQPFLVNHVPSRGLKILGKPHLRCRDCYFEVRDRRLYVMCKTHPRHKQAQMKKREDKYWILTHATQSPRRPW